MGKHAVAAVKPAVGPPDEAVQRLVRVLIAPAVEQHLRRAVGAVVAVGIGNEQQLRRCADPDAAEAHSNPLTRFSFSANTVRLSNWPSPSASSKIRIRSWASASGSAARIAVGLGDPQPAAIVDGHGDRLPHVRLAGKSGDRKALGQLHGLGRGLGRQAGKIVLIVGPRQTGWAGRKAGLVLWKRKSSKFRCPQPPLCRSTRRMKIYFPSCGFRSTATGVISSASSPEALKITWPYPCDQLTARFGVPAAADAERRERVGHCEGNRG